MGPSVHCIASVAASLFSRPRGNMRGVSKPLLSLLLARVLNSEGGGKDKEFRLPPLPTFVTI